MADVNDQTGTEERSRAMDTELLAISRVLRILEELSDDGKRLAVAYLHDRYAVSA